jgi:hypothetical protein
VELASRLFASVCCPSPRDLPLLGTVGYGAIDVLGRSGAQ